MKRCLAVLTVFFFTCLTLAAEGMWQPRQLPELKDELQRRFAARGDEITIVNHRLGYELRCARPTTHDLGYTRDLGHGGVRLLLDSTRDLPAGVMVTMRAGNLVPVPFEKGRVRLTFRDRWRSVI